MYLKYPIRPLYRYFRNILLCVKYNSRVEPSAIISSLSTIEGGNYFGEHCIVTNCNIGYGTYISAYSDIQLSDIGRFTSIGQYVHVFSGTHPLNFVSTYPSFYSKLCVTNIEFDTVEESCFDEQKKTMIGNDVWIGSNVCILGGVSIGDGAIIAAGAVVTKNVAPYEIVGGVPAKFIKKRFSDETIASLLEISWWDKDLQWLNNNAWMFSNVNRFTSLFM